MPRAWVSCVEIRGQPGKTPALLNKIICLSSLNFKMLHNFSSSKYQMVTREQHFSRTSVRLISLSPSTPLRSYMVICTVSKTEVKLQGLKCISYFIPLRPLFYSLDSRFLIFRYRVITNVSFMISSPQVYGSPRQK